MRVPGLLGCLLLVASCSDGDPTTAEDGAATNVVSPATTPVVSVVPGETPGTTAIPRDGLTAKVSPLTAGVSGLNTRITDMGLVIDLPADALFEFDKADLTPTAEVELRKAAEVIRKSPPGSIQVIGHTDSKGDDAYNQALSEARAKAVGDWFGQQVGVRQRQFVKSGKGETAPVGPNTTAAGKDDPAGRAKNRRVEVIVPTP